MSYLADLAKAAQDYEEINNLIQSYVRLMSKFEKLCDCNWRRSSDLWSLLVENFFVCSLSPDHHDLTVGRYYEVDMSIQDEKEFAIGYYRIVDDSGEDYLYHKWSFGPPEKEKPLWDRRKRK